MSDINPVPPSVIENETPVSPAPGGDGPTPASTVLPRPASTPALVETLGPSFFGRYRWLLLTILVAIFGAGIYMRVNDLTDAPLDFNPTRQLHSALIARGMYYENLTSAPAWQRDMAVAQWKAEGLIEPQIMERITAWTYALAGGADLWIPRLYASFFWVLGGVFLYLLGRDLTNEDGGVIAVTIYLILPFSAIASRAFQPDPLMVCVIIMGLWAQYHWYRTPTWKWTIIAGLLSGLSIYVKSVAVFFVAGSIAGLVLGGIGIRKAIRDPKVWALGILTVLPYGIYYYYTMYVLRTLEDQFALRFFEQMWTDPVFYLRWIGQIKGVTGYGTFLLALLGTFAFPKRSVRAMFIGLWAGYFTLGLVLDYNMSTHDYYHLPMIPIAALCLGALAAAVMQRIHWPGRSLFVYAAVVGILVLGVTTTAWDVRVTLKRTDYSNEPPYWQKLGASLQGKGSVVALTHDYGYRIEYWGWLPVQNWMTSGDFNVRMLAGATFDERSLFKEATNGKDLFLVTLLGELDHQPVLKDILYNQYTMIDHGDGYVLFDLRKPKTQ
jgi:hypothetical protein